MALTAERTLVSLTERLVRDGEIAPGDLTVERALLSTLTGFRTGGPAAVVYPATEEALLKLMGALRRETMPYFILGNGTNVLAKDEGYDGAVVCLTKLTDVRVTGETLFAACGAGLTRVSSFAEQNGLTGLEFAYGIPGSVGGAVFMNAGAYDGECSQIVSCVRTVTPEGTFREFTREEMAFGHRESVFQHNGCVILSAVFSLQRGDRAQIRGKMEELMARRREKQPLDYPSCGSTFKHYEGRYTAKMIDEAGLKGTRVGGAMVSEKHAGFIINYDGATSADILSLIDVVKAAIREKEGVDIECEIRFLS